jgi:hypothetical protein
LDHQAVSGALSVCQALLVAALSISLVLSSVWQAVLPDCPATLSVCQAVSLACRAGPSDCPGMSPLCRALQSAELSACQAVSLAWRAGVPSDFPATFLVCRAVWLEYRVVC